MNRIDYFLDFQKLESITNTNYCFDERDKASFKIEFLKQTYLNKPAKKFKQPVMLYLGNKKYSIKYELEEILEMIKNGATKAETEYHRKHFSGSEYNPQKQQFLNSLKSFTPCGIFYNRKTRIEIKQLNGIVMLQNMYEELDEQLLQQIKEDKLTFAVFRILDSNKYAVLVKTNGIKSKNYKKFQQYIDDHYRKLLNVNILRNLPINLPLLLSFDATIHINSSSTIVSVLNKT